MRTSEKNAAGGPAAALRIAPKLGLGVASKLASGVARNAGVGVAPKLVQGVESSLALAGAHQAGLGARPKLSARSGQLDCALRSSCARSGVKAGATGVPGDCRACHLTYMPVAGPTCLARPGLQS